MPGGRGFVDSPTWFADHFGFSECSFRETQSRFEFADGVLKSTVNKREFHVGPFETPSVAELRTRVHNGGGGEAGGITFENIVGQAKTLHLDPRNAGAVFQVASQFNCLEMVGPGSRPEDGVTRYYCDATQGPACALACPAATVFRNYFAGGHGQAGGRQIDCLADVGDLVGNAKNSYWEMKNGYAMPNTQKGGGIGVVSKLLANDEALAEAARSRLRIGVHWDTEVKSGSHRVCQVFSSALPVSYAKGTRSSEWAPLACAVLDGTFEAALAVGAVLASERGARVPVYLTAVGGGAFGNRSQWIVGAMQRALLTFADAPLDVRLVHFGSVPRSCYTGLGKVVGHSSARPQSISGGACQRAAQAKSGAEASMVTREEASAVMAVSPAVTGDDGDDELNQKKTATMKIVTALFKQLDENNDGVIERDELVRVLGTVHPFFTREVSLNIFGAADANGDNEVHYCEFVAWIFKADPSVVGRLLHLQDGRTSLAADVTSD
eukprot:TRINITY_DN41121_c0_g1_i1.p1 TRINITY_DN41121_c0_g1~~TRINITY_DN41121_c0_g1_i1.p1  ORF type:complete len:495 (+),score=102.75 TRINITY_DN41121_c0_g1_i1:91-1575(+)